MNVASLELCKELYEVSGWRPDEGKSYHRQDDSSYEFDTGRPARHSNPPELEPSFIPAYDLGYLLQKLPAFRKLTLDGTSYDCRLEIRPAGFGVNARKYKTPRYLPRPKPVRWCAVYVDVAGAIVKIDVQDSPENALCGLAINLFKQHILERAS